MKYLAFIILTISLNAHAWDFSVKGEGSHSSTNNVNLTNTNPISDSFNMLGGYAQMKNESWRFRIKARTEKYSKETENDNYSTDVSAQYKFSKNFDVTGTLFKQVYNGKSLVSTDETSDNSGGRLSATLSRDLDKNTSGFFTITGTAKNYPKIAGRKDKILGASTGLEHYFTKDFMVSPELSLQNNSSSDSYYKNISYGPALIISYTPNDNWEFFSDLSYAYTSYSGRTVATKVKGKTVNKKEYQEFKNFDVGAIYSFANYFNVQVKYNTGTNTSNNSTAGYKADILSLNFGVRI